MSVLLAEVPHARALRRSRVDDTSLSVVIVAKDPILRAGVERQLTETDGISVTSFAPGCHPDVTIVVTDGVDGEVVGWVRAVRRCSLSRIVVIANAITPVSAAWAVDAGANAVLPRSMADSKRLVGAIRTAFGADGAAVAFCDGDGRPPATEPPVTRAPAERGPAVNQRDREVLRLLADGCDTGEIAQRLAYSEPTIKNAIQRLFDQFKAKNRPHLVAVAIRDGVI